ncbi:MAG TPA: SRPBCC family protein [Acidimicrobiia bacterium]
MATPFRFDRAWTFAVTPEELWQILEQTDQYPTWWPWLREFDVQGAGLADGSTARAVIQAPLPYQLRCTIEVDEAVRAERLRTRVTGDLEGPAELELAATPTGSAARLAWSLDVRSSLLRPFATVARPMLAWAHDRIVERGLVQFEARALQQRHAGD